MKHPTRHKRGPPRRKRQDLPVRHRRRLEDLSGRRRPRASGSRSTSRHINPEKSTREKAIDRSIPPETINPRLSRNDEAESQKMGQAAKIPMRERDSGEAIGEGGDQGWRV